MAPKCARLLIGATALWGRRHNQPFQREGRMRAVTRGGGSGTRDGSFACRRRVLRVIPRADRRSD